MAEPTEGYDSDTETALQPIDYNNVSRDEAIKALKSTQMYAMKLLDENRRPRQENSALRAAAPKKRAHGQNEDVLGYKSQIPDPPENPRDQFTSDAAYTTSMAIALFEQVPPKFHSLLDIDTVSNFANDFIREHSDGRSSFLNMLRKTMPTILNDVKVDANLLIKAKADRSKDPALTALLKFPDENKYSRFPPVLFPGPTRNMTLAFTGSYFMKTHRAMYFGPGSLAPGAKPALNSNGIRLKLEEVTAASMSAAAIGLRLVLSPDTEWNSKGSITGITANVGTEGASENFLFWDVFKELAYMELLEGNRDQPHIKKIFKKVHDFVFAGVDLATSSPADEDVFEMALYSI
ncbi:hypothetical protein B0H13DRAFT_2309861 [Mycena leptocephala]|nr:hypothetical protein B0H13DRAFT_2309861 [Mycena leptocephala]